MKPADRVAFVLGTWFGCGASPLAPGTVGSIGAVPLHLLLCRLPVPVHLASILAVAFVGTWAAHRVALVLGQKDPQRVVIDEVLGVLLAMGAVRGAGVVPSVAALALFRFLDITKPGLIGRAEHAKPVGLGIMLDDALAGFAAAALVRGAMFVTDAL